MIPDTWKPAAKMKRIIVHWTAGGHKANATDKKHYHILIEGDGTLIRGNHSIKANEVISGPYAAHTLNSNTGSIGVSLCGMVGAKESPFSAGNAPLTQTQWDTLIPVVADLCETYKIPVSPTTVLSHAEVGANLGIRQNGKWDITRLPFNPSIVGARAVGDKLRSEVKQLMNPLTTKPPTAETTPMPNSSTNIFSVIAVLAILGAGAYVFLKIAGYL